MAFGVLKSSSKFVEAEALKFPLDVTNNHLIFLPLFSESFHLYLKFLKEINCVNIIIFFESSVLIFQSFEYTVVFLHFWGKLIVHFQHYCIFLLEFLFQAGELIVEMLFRTVWFCLELVDGLCFPPIIMGIFMLLFLYLAVSVNHSLKRFDMTIFLTDCQFQHLVLFLNFTQEYILFIFEPFLSFQVGWIQEIKLFLYLRFPSFAAGDGLNMLGEVFYCVVCFLNTVLESGAFLGLFFELFVAGDEGWVGSEDIADNKFFLLFQSFEAGIDGQDACQSSVQNSIFISFDEKFLFVVIQIPINFQILAFDKAVLMHIDNNLSNLADNLLVGLIVLFIGREFRGEEELAGIIFFYFYVLGLGESVVSKTHHG